MSAIKLLFWVFDQKKGKNKALEALDNKEITLVNDCFKNERIAVFALFLQRLIKEL